VVVVFKKVLARCRKLPVEIQDFLEEKGIGSADQGRLSRLQRFAHFWLLTAKSFSRNRCPVRAAALAYTTLLALIPMLVVALGVSTSILKKEGEQRITEIIDKFVATVVPPAMAETNATNGVVVEVERAPRVTGETNNPAASPAVGNASDGDVRKQAARSIQTFIQNTKSASLGITGTILLVFVAISMLSRVEATFNDIWGVSQGRSWISRVVQYWAVITLGPVLLAAALGLASGPHLQSTKALLGSMPFVGSLLFQFLPVVVLCLAFGSLYMLMPNTRVHWRAALAGGLVGGILWHLNNYFSVLYVSRVVTNSKIYGGLAMVPVFMVGLYFDWLILLFGAQVSYAYQNRAAYLQEKQMEHISQRGREFIALRLMECIGQRFQHGDPPATVLEIADGLAVPTRLVQRIMLTLMNARLVVEVAGEETGYTPARPLETITCHDILLALRAGNGQELGTRDGPGRAEVGGEFQRILEAERKAASAVSVLALVNRTEAIAGKAIKAVGGGKLG
jgi:membrane protein